MSPIVHHNASPSTLRLYRTVLRSIRAADLTDGQADVLWYLADLALELPGVDDQLRQLRFIQRQIGQLSRREKAH